MVSVAAGLARQDFEVWVYSIAPFCYARPFEQIRNDVAFHGLPVKLVGNGGGYGYGVMGPTHHAIEDYGVLLCLPNLRVFVPAFDEDVAATVARAGDATQAAYVRLGRGEKPAGYDVPAYAPWRPLTRGDGPVVIVVGPLVGLYLDAFHAMPEAERPNLWAVSELPLAVNPLPEALLQQIAGTARLCIAEEHVAHGGFASDLILELAKRSIPMPALRHLSAQAHHYERYGSQTYLRHQSGLDVLSMQAALASLTS
jgi:transketolase